MSGDDYDDLLAGVQDALREAGVHLDSPELLNGLRDALQDLDGAAAPDSPPKLRVVTPDEGQDNPPSPSVQRRVIRIPRRAETLVPGAGALVLEAGTWQTVYRGNSAQTYRVACVTGALDLALDGELVERITPGQSVDVEGTLVRVHSADAAATGTYRRV